MRALEVREGYERMVNHEARLAVLTGRLEDLKLVKQMLLSEVDLRYGTEHVAAWLGCLRLLVPFGTLSESLITRFCVESSL